MSKFPIAPLEVTRFPCFVATPWGPGKRSLALTPRRRVVQLVELCCLSPAQSINKRQERLGDTLA